MTTPLDFEDIQHFLLTRTPALAARYEFLSFESAAAGRAWLAGLVPKVGTGQSVGNASPDARWVTIAFTCNGLRALGIDDAALSTFPEEFRQGMAARAGVLGMAGNSSADRWVGDVASPALHAIVILFARDVPERDRCEQQHREYLSTLTGVKVLSVLNLEALPPFDGIAREHFGYRDRLSQPIIAGTGEQPTPGSGPAVRPVSSSSATTTKAARRLRSPSRRSCRATAAFSPTCAWRNTSRRSGNSYGRNRRRRTSRNCWRRS